MGLLIFKNGAFRMNVIKEIDPSAAQILVSTGELSELEIRLLASKAHHYFSKDITSYGGLVESLYNLNHSSYGMPTGHEGLNELFLEMCRMGIEEERLQEEIVKGLEKSRI